MNRGRLLGLLASIGLMLTACQDRNTDDEAFGKRVRAYLLSHPEMLQEMRIKDNNQAQVGGGEGSGMIEKKRC